MAYVVDQVMESNVLATMILSRAKQWEGDRCQFPVQIAKPTNGGSFAGYDILTTVPEDNEINLEYDPKFVRQSFTLPYTELMINSAPGRVRSLMGSAATKTAIGLADQIGTMFYADGTGNGGKDMLGLEALVDDGTNTATIGGQSRATYTPLNSSVTDSGGTMTLAQVRSVYSGAKFGSVKPTLGVTTEAVFDLFDQLLEQKARYNETSPGKARVGVFGFDTIKYRGVDIVSDEKCTEGTLYFLNENFLHFKTLKGDAEGVAMKPIMFKKGDVRGNDFASRVPGFGFQHTGKLTPVNQLALVDHIVIGGNLMTDMPRAHSKLTGITGV
jgi:hypothetical protein